MRRTVAAWLIGTMLGAGVAWADTLVLLDGSRIEGRLLGVRDDVIEFEERGSRRRIVRHRDEVARLEFVSGRNESPGFGGGDSRGGGPPRGLLKRDIVVQARDQFTPTGITVRPGQMIYIEASGEIRWGRGDREDGPAGERNSPPNGARPIPGSPAAALIGRVGEDAANLFLIGAEPGPFRMRASGQLFLGINDDTFIDNSGFFRVAVSY